MQVFWQDLQYAVRMMRRAPGLTLAVALSIGAAIGVNTAVFSVVNAVFFRSLPVSDPTGIVMLYRTVQQPADTSAGAFGQGLFPISYPNFDDLRARATSFTALAAFSLAQYNVSSGGDPEQVPGQFVSASYFPLLGIQPAAGRFFAPDEDRRGGAPVVVLAHGLWNRRFGGTPDIVGQTIVLNGRPVTVIGVAPPRFHGLNILGTSQLWMPVGMLPEFRTGVFAEGLDRRDLRFFGAVGRLAEGTDLAAAEAELRTIALRLEEEHPAVNRNRGFAALPLAESMINPNQRDLFVRVGMMLMGAVGLVLLIAMANVSSLLLARAAGRQTEFAMRMALGASRRRIVRQLLTESMVLAILGGATGGVLALWAREILWTQRPPFLDNASIDLAMDRRVLLFTAAAIALTGLLTGLAPAFQTARADLARRLGSRGAASGPRFAMRRILIATQVALTLVALVASTLFFHSVRNAQQIDPGFESEQLLGMTVDAGAQGYPADRRRQLYERVLEEVGALPGVVSASLSSVPPLSFGAQLRVVIPGKEDVTGPDGIYISTSVVSNTYFETLGVRLIEGRVFGNEDSGSSRRVAVVNETMARRLWPSEDPVGRWFRVPFQGAPLDLEIVGVVADIKYATLGEPPTPYFYQPLSQEIAPAVTLLVRTAAAPSAMLDPVRRRVQALDRGLPLTSVEVIGDAIRQSLWAPALAASLFGAFGLLALALAAAGIYGLVAHLVEARRAEIGIRLALGASRPTVLRLVLRQILQPVAAGLLVGIGVGLATTRLLDTLLYGLSGTEPSAFLTAAVVLLAIAALACIVPARRAMRVDPAVVLRSA